MGGTRCGPPPPPCSYATAHRSVRSRSDFEPGTFDVPSLPLAVLWRLSFRSDDGSVVKDVAFRTRRYILPFRTGTNRHYKFPIRFELNQASETTLSRLRRRSKVVSATRSAPDRGKRRRSSSILTVPRPPIIYVHACSDDQQAASEYYQSSYRERHYFGPRIIALLTALFLI
ncbi:hypothetical protein EVAR_59734_1 [Eumeta japonica]|uniref:Uncharacterized protein n=1 Tax=Eumeta variegata TaxID=151549 RepID=A0A4C1Z4K9_EUMVA|nr:hypothetical protein EVAR_59734_1 [Eumeta japonica]